MSLVEFFLLAIAVGIYGLIREVEKLRKEHWQRWERQCDAQDANAHLNY